jgi:hypothetical protein
LATYPVVVAFHWDPGLTIDAWLVAVAGGALVVQAELTDPVVEFPNSGWYGWLGHVDQGTLGFVGFFERATGTLVQLLAVSPRELENVDVRVSQVDATVDTIVARLSSVVGTGIGKVAVPSDYGGLDLRFETPDGQGIGDAIVTAYAADDYAAGRTAPEYVRGQTITLDDGTWKLPLMLNPGDYTLVYYKERAYEAVYALTVLPAGA